MSAVPVLISFYCGDRSYYIAADRLREDCDALGIEHDIVEIPKGPDDTWLDVCRRKPAFYLQMQRKHRRPIMWLDVDSRLGKRPVLFDGAACDLAGFLRGWRYLRDFDAAATSRIFAPFALLINNTPAATAFLELMLTLEQEYPDAASDDYFLHEAWLRHERQLSVMILPPSLVGHEWPLRDEQAIYVGISGNVKTFKAQATQHAVPLFDAARRKAVLMKEAAEVLKAEQIGDALTLYRRALLADPDDAALAQKIARLEQRK